jgi:hypothetical protein
VSVILLTLLVWICHQHKHFDDEIRCFHLYNVRFSCHTAFAQHFAEAAPLVISEVASISQLASWRLCVVAVKVLILEAFVFGGFGVLLSGSLRTGKCLEHHYLLAVSSL